jgi:hypothetical protein
MATPHGPEERPHERLKRVELRIPGLATLDHEDAERRDEPRKGRTCVGDHGGKTLVG